MIDDPKIRYGRLLGDNAPPIETTQAAPSPSCKRWRGRTSPPSWWRCSRRRLPKKDYKHPPFLTFIRRQASGCPQIRDSRWILQTSNIQAVTIREARLSLPNAFSPLRKAIFRNAIDAKPICATFLTATCLGRWRKRMAHFAPFHSAEHSCRGCGKSKSYNSLLTSENLVLMKNRLILRR